MAVLIEGISVVVRCEAVVRVHPGGAAAFTAEVPNQTMCADGELARVGFMTPRDAQIYVEHLGARGLKYHEGKSALDLVVVDQRAGMLVACDWAEFGSTHWNNNPAQPISVCRAKPTRIDRVVVPNGWTYERSLSANHKFVDLGQMPDSLKFVRSEKNVDVYYDTKTGEELFVGRP
jgi:hypothetical protein